MEEPTGEEVGGTTITTSSPLVEAVLVQEESKANVRDNDGDEEQVQAAVVAEKVTLILEK